MRTHGIRIPETYAAVPCAQLNSQITAERNVHFEAFSLVKADGVDFHNSREAQFKWLKTQGFEVVEYRMVDASNLEEAVPGICPGGGEKRYSFRWPGAFVR